jgi:tetratricopeptide (TPR) repeat protein
LLLETIDISNKIEQSEIYNYLGLVYLSLNNHRQASFYLEKAISMFKAMYGEGHVKTLMASLNLVNLYKNSKECVKALTTLDNAINLCSNNKEASEIYLAILHRVLGTCYFELGNEVKGLLNFSKANTIHKNYINISKIPINEISTMIQNMYGIIVV